MDFGANLTNSTSISLDRTLFFEEGNYLDRPGDLSRKPVKIKCKRKEIYDGVTKLVDNMSGSASAEGTSLVQPEGLNLFFQDDGGKFVCKNGVCL